MKNLLSIFLLLSVTAFGADTIIGLNGNNLLIDNASRKWDATVIYTTDGAGNVIPIGSSSVTIGTVTQGAQSVSAAPWQFDLEKILGAAPSSTNYVPSRITNGTTYVDPTQIRALSSGTDSVMVQGGNSTAVKVDGSAVTQPVSISGTVPVSGTITANIGTSGSLALDASVTAIGAKLGSLGQKTMAGSAPVVLASDQSSIPVSQATGTNLHTVVDSGTITANIGTTGSLALNATLTQIQGSTGSTVPTKAGLLGGSDGTNLQALAVTSGGKVLVEGGNSTALKVDGSAVTQPVSGTLAVTQSGNWNQRLQDGSGNAITSQVNGGQRPLDVGVVVSGTQVDPRSIRALTSADVVTANIKDSSGASITLGQKTSANSIPVVLPSDAAGMTVNQSTASNLKASVNVNDGSGNSIPSQSISSSNYLQVIQPSSATAGSAVPSRSNLISGKDGSGNAQSVSVDTSGHIQNSPAVTRLTQPSANTDGAYNSLANGPFGELIYMSAAQAYTAWGKMWNAFTGVINTGSTAEVALLLISNPNASGVNLKIRKIVYGSPSSASATDTYNLYKDPTVTANGTTLTPVGNRQTGQATLQSSLFTSPTVSANGTLIDGIRTNGAVIPMIQDKDFSVWLEANHKLLWTVTQSGTAASAAGFVEVEFVEQ